VALPQTRATEELFRSRLAQAFREDSDVLGQMVTEVYVRELFTRDVENMFIPSFGERLLSRSSVSRLAHRLQRGFDNWRKRDLSGLKVLYLFTEHNN